MITAIVQIDLPEPLAKDKARDIFMQSAHTYRKVDGLIRKYYILTEDGSSAGGVYLWTSIEIARAFYSQEWKTFIIQKYGVAPSITYFHSPVVVDNLANKITLDPFNE
jgi:hypothetical protein